MEDTYVATLVAADRHMTPSAYKWWAGFYQMGMCHTDIAYGWVMTYHPKLTSQACIHKQAFGLPMYVMFLYLIWLYAEYLILSLFNIQDNFSDKYMDNLTQF